MIITLKDGSKKEYSEAKSVIDIAYDISEGLARAACAGEVNGEVVDLRTVLDSDCELNILTAKDEKGRKLKLLSDLLLIQDFIMTSLTNHSPVRISMKSRKK